MNPVIMQLKTELAKSNKEFGELNIKALRLMNEIRNNLNPYYGDDIDSIKAAEVEQAADELLCTKNKLVSTKLKISKLERELNG